VTTPLDETSPPWCLRLLSEFTAADERATALAKTLTPRQLNWKPRPETWSVGQCLDHLCVANRFKNPFIPVLRFTVGTGLEILAKHERRHLLQAERIRDSPEFPVS
jgi:hypothetical protein